MLQVNSRNDVSGGSSGDGSFDESLVLSYGCRVATTSDQTVTFASPPGWGTIIWHTDSDATYGCYDNGGCWTNGNPGVITVPSGVPDDAWILWYFNIIKDHSNYAINNIRAHTCQTSITPIKFNMSFIFPAGSLRTWGGRFSSEYNASHTVYAGSTAGFAVIRGSFTP